MSLRYLTLDEALHVCKRLGIGPVRDLGLLGSAIERPRTTLFGLDAYPDLASKAAAMTESIVCKHALLDGNKRLGWACLVLFIARNGTRIEVQDDEAYDVIVSLAAGRMGLGDLTAGVAGWIDAG